MGGKGSGGARPGGGNKGVRAENVDAAFNSRVIAFNRELYSFDLVDFEPENVESRFMEYLEICDRYGMKPTVSGVSLAFGLDRRRFNEIANGCRHSYMGWKITPETVGAFQKIYKFLESVLENYLSDETKNPAKWIFLAKNHFGYSDTREQIVTHREDAPTLPSAQEIAQRLGMLNPGSAAGELPEAEIIEISDGE